VRTIVRTIEPETPPAVTADKPDAANALRTDPMAWWPTYDMCAAEFAREPDEGGMRDTVLHRPLSLRFENGQPIFFLGRLERKP
jgi:hypothetical protein